MADPLDFAIDLKSVRERVRALDYFAIVEDIQAGVQAFAELTQQPRGAFVSVASEVAEPNKLVGGHSQRVAVTISVLFCEQAMRALGDQTDRVELTRRLLIRQLIAWTPDNAGSALQYARYNIRGVTGGLIWGEVLFTTSYRVSI